MTSVAACFTLLNSYLHFKSYNLQVQISGGCTCRRRFRKPSSSALIIVGEEVNAKLLVSNAGRFSNDSLRRISPGSTRIEPIPLGIVTSKLGNPFHISNIYDDMLRYWFSAICLCCKFRNNNSSVGQCMAIALVVSRYSLGFTLFCLHWNYAEQCWQVPDFVCDQVQEACQT